MPFAMPGQSIVWHAGRRVVVGGGVVSLQADILLDFANGVYRVDGVSYASAAAAGFPGTGTFNASGYTPTGTDGLTGTVNLPGDYIVYVEAATPSAGAVDKFVWNHASGSANARVYYDSVNEQVILQPSNVGNSGGAGMPARVAYGRQGSAYRYCFNGGTVNVGGGSISGGSASFYIGNGPSTLSPFGAAIRRLAIYKQTLTDAQIQTLGAA